MHFATAILCPLILALADPSLSASAQERASSTAVDAPVTAPKPADPDAGHPPLLRADSEIRIRADAQNIHTTATIRYTALRGAVDRVRFTVAGSERLLAVLLDGETAPHETAADGDFTTVTVRLKSRVRNSVSLRIHTQRPRSDFRLDLGGQSEDQFLRPLDVLQSHGVLLLACDPAFDLLIDETRGLIETVSLPEQNAPNAHWRCFHFYGPRLRLQAALVPARAQIHTVQHACYTLCEGDLHLHSDFTCEAADPGVFDVRLELPEGFALEKALVNGEPTIHRIDGRALSFSFARAHPKVRVSVTGRAPWQSAPAQALPLVGPLDAASHTGTITFAAPAGFDVQLTGDALSPLDPETLTRRATASRNMSARAWRYETSPAAIHAHVSRAQPRISAHLESDVRIGAEHAAITTVLGYNVRRTGTRTFRFALPERAEAIQIDELGGPARILQRTQAEADRPGWTAWTLRMNRDVLGPQQFRVDWTVPLDHDRGAEESERRLVLSPPRVLASSHEATEILGEASGAMTLRGDDPLALYVDRASGGLKRETAEGDDIIFHHDNNPAEMEIDVSPGEPGAVSTLISRALIDIRPASGGAVDYECLYHLQSDPSRLPIQLPAGAEPLNALFDGAPVPLLRATRESEAGDYDAYEVNLSGIERSAAQRLLLVRFRTPLDGSGLTRRRGSLAAPLPLPGELDGSSVAVAETLTRVWLPEHLAVIGTPRGFARSGRGWSADAAASRAPDTVPHVFENIGRPEAILIAYWDRAFATWLLSGAALLMGLVLCPTAGENRLTMILLGTVVLALLSLAHPHAIAQGLFAARWGLAATCILWAAFAARARTSQTVATCGANNPVAAVISPAPSAKSRRGQFRKGA